MLSDISAHELSPQGTYDLYNQALVLNNCEGLCAWFEEEVKKSDEQYACAYRLFNKNIGRL